MEIDTEKLQSLETVSQAVAYMKEMERKKSESPAGLFECRPADVGFGAL